MAKRVSFAIKPETKTVDEWVENPTAEEKKMRFTIDIPESLHRRMTAQCALRGVQMNNIIQELLERAFPA